MVPNPLSYISVTFEKAEPKATQKEKLPVVICGSISSLLFEHINVNALGLFNIGFMLFPVE